MDPLGCRALGYGRSCMIDSAVTDLPEPLSPTSAADSPRSISNETWRTAWTSPPSTVNDTERSRTESSGLTGPRSLDLARVEGVSHRLADEDEEREHDGEHDEAGETEPGRLEVGLALGQDLAERGGAGR